MNSETSIWEEIINHEDYEICGLYPYEIRKKSNNKIVKESLNNKGYYQVHLDGKTYLKHRVLATQWIPNDDPAFKDQVDHINRDKTDNRLENLRWVSASENNVNRSMSETIFIDELPEFTIRVSRYGNHNIKGLYFCDDVFYVYTGINYKSLKKSQDHRGNYFIQVKLPDKPQLKIYYNKFKHEYGIED